MFGAVRQASRTAHAQSSRGAEARSGTPEAKSAASRAAGTGDAGRRSGAAASRAAEAALAAGCEQADHLAADIADPQRGAERLLGRIELEPHRVAEQADRAAGLLLGGVAGVGTVLFALAIGPLTQLMLPWFTIALEAPGRTLVPGVAGPGAGSAPRRDHG